MSQINDTVVDLVQEHKQFELLFKEFFTTLDPFNQRLILDTLMRTAAIHLVIEKTVLVPHLIHIPEHKQIFIDMLKKAENLLCIMSEWITTHLDQDKCAPAEWPAWPATVIVGMKNTLAELKAFEMAHALDIPRHLSPEELQTLYQKMEVVRAQAANCPLPAIPSLSLVLEVVSSEENVVRCVAKGLSKSCEPAVLPKAGVASP